MEGKIAALGSADFVMPFSALGTDAFAVTNQHDDIIDKAQKILQGSYALIVVAENVAASANEIFKTVQNQATPCVLVVPFTAEPEGIATDSLRKAIKMATGTDIFSM